MKESYVQLHQDRITTTSMKVAEIFGKRHDNVLRSIQNLECSQEFKLLNFEEHYYKTLNNQKQPLYFITKDGFMMLAMGFTGETAVRFREMFIAAFNRMEQALRVATSPVLLPVYQHRMLSEPTKTCPDNRWCVFDYAGEVMLWIEKNVGSISQYDLADGSIGQHWVKFREGKPWRKPITHYYHEYQDKRGKQQSNCYDYTELEHFKVWLKKVYMKEHLYKYLYDKYKKDALMLPRVKAIEPKLIG